MFILWKSFNIQMDWNIYSWAFTQVLSPAIFVISVVFDSQWNYHLEEKYWRKILMFTCWVIINLVMQCINGSSWQSTIKQYVLDEFVSQHVQWLASTNYPWEFLWLHLHQSQRGKGFVHCLQHLSPIHLCVEWKDCEAQHMQW